jgi:hypothetical protein
VHVSKMSETNFLLFFDSGHIYMVSIEDRIDIMNTFKMKPVKEGVSSNYGVSFEVYFIMDTH